MWIKYDVEYELRGYVNRPTLTAMAQDIESSCLYDLGLLIHVNLPLCYSAKPDGSIYANR